MTCPNCGAAAPTEAERCPGCDVPLAVSCPECGAHVQPGDDEECSVCGGSLAHAGEIS